MTQGRRSDSATRLLRACHIRSLICPDWIVEAACTAPLSRPSRPSPRFIPAAKPPWNSGDFEIVPMARARPTRASGCTRPLNNRRSNAGREAMRSFLESPHW